MTFNHDTGYTLIGFAIFAWFVAIFAAHTTWKEFNETHSHHQNG